MIYLSEFEFPSYDEEYAFRLDKVKRTCYNTMYPFFVLSAHGLERLDFAPVTIFYGGNVRERSNGESAFLYFEERIGEGTLCLLDEPENSLSPERQNELKEFLEQSARYFDCQLVIATHSPFLLSMNGAKIYDFDETPVDVKRWTELKNVRAYYEFFKRRQREFEI